MNSHIRHPLSACGAGSVGAMTIEMLGRNGGSTAGEADRRNLGKCASEVLENQRFLRLDDVGSLQKKDFRRERALRPTPPISSRFFASLRLIFRLSRRRAI